MGVADGDVEVSGVDARVEVVGLPLEAVFVCTVGEEMALVAAAGAGEGDLESGEEEEGEVGLEGAANGLVEGEDSGGAEAAAATLVGLGGIGEAIAEDDGSGGERGSDDVGDGLGPVGEHEGELGGGSDGAEGGFGAGIDEDGADAVAQGGGAGLTKGDDPVAGGFKRGCEAAELGGFS